MVVHWLVTLAITVGILGGVGIGAIAWRLSKGPMDLDWFTGLIVDRGFDLLRHLQRPTSPTKYCCSTEPGNGKR